MTTAPSSGLKRPRRIRDPSSAQDQETERASCRRALTSSATRLCAARPPVDRAGHGAGERDRDEVDLGGGGRDPGQGANFRVPDRRPAASSARVRGSSTKVRATRTVPRGRRRCRCRPHLQLSHCARRTSPPTRPSPRAGRIPRSAPGPGPGRGREMAGALGDPLANSSNSTVSGTDRRNYRVGFSATHVTTDTASAARTDVRRVAVGSDRNAPAEDVSDGEVILLGVPPPPFFPPQEGPPPAEIRRVLRGVGGGLAGGSILRSRQRFPGQQALRGGCGWFGDVRHPGSRGSAGDGRRRGSSAPPSLRLLGHRR